MTLEKMCANAAYELVRDAGGSVTFEEYDRLASHHEFGFIPMQWGGAALDRPNFEKLCVFAACREGTLRQEDGRYVVVA